MNTYVVNLHELEKTNPNWRDDPKYVYIGRAGKGLDGKFGNPFPMKGEENRAACLLKYINWLLNLPYSKWTFYNDIKDLKGKILVCFCAPKLCHGNILALLAELL